MNLLVNVFNTNEIVYLKNVDDNYNLYKSIPSRNSSQMTALFHNRSQNLSNNFLFIVHCTFSHIVFYFQFNSAPMYI